MKLIQYRSLFELWYKSVVISLLAIFCLPSLGHAINVDSLKHVLKTSNNQETNSTILFEIYQHYHDIDQIDSMHLYAKRCLNDYSLSNREIYPKISSLISDQYRQGFANNINPIVDSLLIVIRDPDIKLKLLVKLSEASFYSEEKEAFDNYWSQAEKTQA